MSKNREQRLLEDKQRLNGRLDTLKSEQIRLQKEENQLLEYLNTRGALEEYTAINKRASDLKTEINKLESGKKVSEKYTKSIKQFEKDLAAESIDADKYL
jgi:uncharacterized protein YydD (DUF2326 family)